MSHLSAPPFFISSFYTFFRLVVGHMEPSLLCRPRLVDKINFFCHTEQHCVWFHFFCEGCPPSCFLSIFCPLLPYAAFPFALVLFNSIFRFFYFLFFRQTISNEKCWWRLSTLFEHRGNTKKKTRRRDCRTFYQIKTL